MTFVETELGFEIQTSQFLAFFGKKFAQPETIENYYHQIKFLRLKQVHGCMLVERKIKDLETPTADAHSTTALKLGLCISTADCIPVLIFNSKRISIAAVHAGWRGVAQKIVSHTIQAELDRGASPQDLTVLIGPHIQKTSFEIDSSVLGELLKTCPEKIEGLYSETKNDKFLFDLNALQKFHLTELQIPAENIFTLFLDTKTDQRFHSFRRDKEASGRQQSFICLR